jgi:hypothetical protein
MAEKISKQEAVRRALAHFGNAATPAQMRPWIKDEFGLEMTDKHISTAKGEILRKAGVKGKRPAKPAASKAATPRAAPEATAKKAGPKAAAKPQAAAALAGPKPAAAKAAIPLDDILYIKALVGRFGSEPLHTLIDAFAS